MKNIVVAAVVACTLTGCGGSDSTTSSTAPDAQPARSVDAVEVTITATEIGTGKVIVRGEKPTPCHELRSIIDSTSDPIRIDVWAEPGDAETCAQVLETFEVSLGFEVPTDSSSIVVNGEEVGTVGS